MSDNFLDDIHAEYEIVLEMFLLSYYYLGMLIVFLMHLKLVHLL